MRLPALLASAVLSLTVGFPALAAARPVPVEVWADRPYVRAVSMNPSGTRFAMLQRLERGGRYVPFTFDPSDLENSPVRITIGNDDVEPQSVFWANDDILILNLVLENRLNNRIIRLPRFLSVNVETGETFNLLEMRSRERGVKTARRGVTLGQGRLVSVLGADPEHVLMMWSGADTNGIADYYKVNVNTGARERVLRSNDRLESYIFDRNGQARAAQKYDPNGPRILTLARTVGGEWEEIGALDSRNRFQFTVQGFFEANHPNAATAVIGDAGSDFTGVYAIDITDPSNRELLFRVEGADALGALTSPVRSRTGELVGFSYADRHRSRDYYLDENYAMLQAQFEAAFPDRNVSILSISEDQSTILVYTDGPRAPGSWYMIRNGQAIQIAQREPDIPAKALSPVMEEIVTARDGREIPTLMTIPEGKDPKPGIIMPHGGPWVRDVYGYDEWAQMLANQGYVVIQPNYRGSTGLGREHWLAGDNRWGHEMQDDVDDAMTHAIARGWVDPERTAIFGWSYGGYAAFVAATREPERYNCIAAGAGVADISSIRAAVSGSRFARQFQKPTISGRNPMEDAGQVTRPMLIVHGDRDATVPVEHSRRFVSRLDGIGADYTYIEIEDMGHSPFEYAQNMQWYPELLTFFDTKCGF